MTKRYIFFNLKNSGKGNKLKITRSFLIFVAGLIILILSIYGFSLTARRPNLPRYINPGAVVRIDNFDIKHPREVTFALAGKSSGETARVFWRMPDGKIEEAEVRLVNYYARKSYPLIYLIVGLMSFILGLAVFLLGPRDTRSHLFYWLALCFGAAVMINGELYCLQKSRLSILPGVIYLACYTLIFPLFLHFCLTFVRKRISWEKIPIYLSALVFIVPFEFYFLYSIFNSTIQPYRLYMSSFSLYRLYVIAMILLSVTFLIIGFRRSTSTAEKARISWILYGLFLGVIPFLVFYQLPEILKLKPWLSEESSGLFFIFVPVSLAVAIMKYRLFDIHLIVKRSLAYSLLSILVISVYFFIVEVTRLVFSRFVPVNKTWLSIIGLLTAAAVFHPMREKIQQLVDKTFYRTSYDYKKITLEFSRKAGEVLNCEELTDLLYRTVKDFLPVEKLNVSLIRVDEKIPNTWLKEIHRGDPVDELLPHLSDKLTAFHFLAERSTVQTDERLDFSQEEVLAGQGWALVLILPLGSGDWAGLLALGPKKSGKRFSGADTEFLMMLAEAFILSLEKIRLQGEVIHERASREKLDELNRLKTEFIATVSHELRTPLSSIQGLAEILHSGKVREAKKKAEILALMEEESQRLSNLLHNILDFGRMERGTKAYLLKPTHLQPILEHMASLFSYRLQSEGFVFRLEQPEEPVYLEADAEALEQALINLIDNAIKYSQVTREIHLRLKEDKSEIRIQVEDRGMGMPAEEKGKIFDGFYRGQEAFEVNPGGVGLGLKIVRHIVELHRGRIEVISQPGQGSTFSLVFPRP